MLHLAGKHRTAGYKSRDIVRTDYRHSPIIFHVKASLLSWISVKGLSKTKVRAVKLWKTVSGLCGSCSWTWRNIFLSTFQRKETKQNKKSQGACSSPGASDRSQEQDDALMGNTQAFQAWGQLHAREPQVTMLFEESNSEWYFQTHKRQIFLPVRRKSTLQRH